MFLLNNTISSGILFNNFENFGLTFCDAAICSFILKAQIKYVFNRFLPIAACYGKG